MRLLVVGAGSTGGYFGGRLAEAGRDVTFLVRPRRAAQLQATGLNIVSPHGDVTLRPKLVTADAITAPYDAVLLRSKPIRSTPRSKILPPRSVRALQLFRR
jgi:2-dehydropantoate 2-reductase